MALFSTTNKGGRKKGSVNKIGTQAKDNIIAVFTRLGGTAAMAKWAKDNQTEFYRLYARLIPTDVTATIDIRDASELSTADLLRIAAGSSPGAVEAAAGSDEPDRIH